MNNTLIVFARPPILGKVKTRLAMAIGDKKALVVYKELLNITLLAATQGNANLKIYWAEKQSGENYYQKGTDLGERMYNALKTEVDTNVKICLIGTDVPNLSTSIIAQAFKKLDNNDIVLGPSFDGGYYLIGCKHKVIPELFLRKEWSHQKVLKEALEVCNSLGLTVAQLPTLLDIDTIEDYKKWQNIT